MGCIPAIIDLRQSEDMNRKRGFYEKYVKRVFDVIFALVILILFFWLYLIVALLVRIKLGSPVIFKQPRPGIVNPQTGKESIFYMYKFRTMTNEKDEEGKLLSDEERLTKFGSMLRNTSLDELPEIINIIKGDMSFIGPRPQLVRDMVFMTERQRMRHTAKPGMSGLAQIKGRNAVAWDEKLEWDLKYIERVTLWKDVKIIAATIKMLILPERGGETRGTDITDDYGDVLLKEGRVSREEYDALQKKAMELIAENEGLG